jgi:hypothetical protein
MRACSILVASLIVGSAAPAAAQGIAAGIKAGVSVANLQFIEEEDHIEFDRRVGFTGGLFVVWPANSPVALQAEVLYSQKGSRLDEPVAKIELNLDYVEFPALVRVSTPRKGNGTAFHAFGGPSFGVRARARANATFEGQSGSDDIGDDLKSFDVGLAAGGGLDVGRFVVDARYTWGLTNINNNPREDDTTIRNRVFAVMAGVRF